MKVTVRKRKTRSGKTTLYLEFYINGKRTYEYLDLHLIPGKTPADKQVNKDTLLLAENIRAKRQRNPKRELWLQQKRGQASGLCYLLQKADNGKTEQRDQL